MLDDNSGATPSTQAPATLVGAAARAGDAAAQPTSGRASPSLPPRRGAAVVAGKRGAGPAPAEASTAPKAMPSLPARAAAVNGSNGAAASELGSGVIDPLEPPSTQRLRAAVHDIRVRLIRAARRLGYQHDCGLVKQVLYRLYLAEKLKEPFRKAARRPDAALLAARDASVLESQKGPSSPLGLHVTMLLVGLRGTGKTQLVRSLLAMGDNDGVSNGTAGTADGPDAFAGATERVEVSVGNIMGVTLKLIDTPGLTAGAAGTAANASVLRQLRAAHRRFSPDLVVYVDRFDQPTRSSGELGVLQAVTRAVGPHVWLNTIVALTHAGAAPPGGAGGHVSWDTYSQQRSQLLQLLIRSASGDARLMNPIAFTESHPDCPRNAQGQSVLPSGLAWQQHLLLLVVSAKLLADAEAALQMSPDATGSGGKPPGGSGGALDAAAMRQMLGRPEGPPVRYLMTQLTGFCQPLTYPDHGGVMELRMAQKQLKSLPNWRDRKELSRQIRLRLLQMQQSARRQQRTTDLLTRATRAGGKMQLSQPRTATRARPSVQPPVVHRYRAMEPGSGWVVRPHIEPHGMDNADNIEGFLAERAGVARLQQCDEKRERHEAGRATSGGAADPLLHGVPYRLSSSASAGKDQLLVQARAEASLYHDLQGLATTTLSADIQTSGAMGGPAGADMLLVLRADSQRRGLPLAANCPTLGVLVARLAPGCRPDRGPVATGVRLQDCLRLTAPGGAPLELDAAVGRMFCRGGLEPDDAWGANAELRTDARRLFSCRYASPLSLSASVLQHHGESLGAVSAALQAQHSRRAGVAGRVQINSRGVASFGLQLRSEEPRWWGAAGLVPLGNLAAGWLGALLASRGNARRDQGQAAGGVAGTSNQQLPQQAHVKDAAP